MDAAACADAGSPTGSVAGRVTPVEGRQSLGCARTLERHQIPGAARLYCLRPAQLGWTLGLRRAWRLAGRSGDASALLGCTLAGMALAPAPLARPGGRARFGARWPPYTCRAPPPRVAASTTCWRGAGRAALRPATGLDRTHCSSRGLPLVTGRSSGAFARAPRYLPGG